MVDACGVPGYFGGWDGKCFGFGRGCLWVGQRMGRAMLLALVGPIAQTGSEDLVTVGDLGFCLRPAYVRHCKGAGDWEQGMISGGLRIITLALALVGFVTIALWGVRTTLPRQSKLNALTFINSPDGKFKAVVGQWAESFGAVSSYCYNRVFVVSEAVSDERATDEDNMVFKEKRCGSFTDYLASPVVSWRTPRVLVIRFSILATAVVPGSFQLRRQSSSGEVAIEYEVGW